MKILIVEDNSILRENLEFLLKKFHFLPESAKDWEEAYNKIISQKYDAMVLDLNMPKITWRELIKKLSIINKKIPTIVLTSDSMLEDKISMFELWVDDYLTKPFEIEELVARLKSILRRGDLVLDDIKIHRDVKINFIKKKVYVLDKEITLSHKLYLIIEFLMKNFWYPQSKTKLMEYVWWEQEEKLDFDSTTLESHIYSIRKKIWKDFIKTVKWVWYIIE